MGANRPFCHIDNLSIDDRLRVYFGTLSFVCIHFLSPNLRCIRFSGISFMSILD